MSDDVLRRQMKSWSGKDVLGSQDLLWVSFGVGMINTAFVMPLDCIKTQYQKRNPIDMQPLAETLKNIYKCHGMKGVYAGWQVQMIQYMIQSGLTMNLLKMMGG